MSKEPSKAELEARLQSVSDAMNERFDSLQGEIVSTQDLVRNKLAKHPLASVGGAVAAGLLIGWAFGGSKRRRVQSEHRKLTSAYIDAVRDEVREAIGEGEDVEDAVRGVLKERVPLVVYDDRSRDSESSSFLYEMFEMVARTAITMLARDVIEKVVANANLDETIDENLFS
ncbi:hypothetical protein CRI94_02420 [Longibacter salinarum]|uniref:Uncharacterized protein n=1 Tax=Longibacter salinarum TaxID=1850348 RepID=A0A2A8D3F1_9BACT|nr:hypothetical protein [Longibacter salinarum]PEN15158.1 hypothetical protein CRI94_02420 [Longibacter salinarum]